MFTGLVAAIGTVKRAERGPKGLLLRVTCPFPELVLGESIAVSGCCLTVTTIHEDGFTADASSETLAKTHLGSLQTGSTVHLERALSLGDRLGGHLVSGHVDGIGSLVSRAPSGDAVVVTFEAPTHLAPFLAPKGSITIDGVSLTVNGVKGAHFDVVLVPFTRTETHFDQRPVGAAVNLEVDLIAKYVARLLGRPGVDGVDDSAMRPAPSNDKEMWALLQRQGYTETK